MQSCRRLQQMPNHAFGTEVFRSVRELPLTWSSDPLMEQLSEPDGSFSIDISGVTADGVRLAIEADGPTHFRRPDNGLTGSTMSRNRALAARGYVVVSVPFYEWRQLKEQQAKQRYLMNLLQQQLVLRKDMQQDQQPVVSKAVAAAAASAGRRRKRQTNQQMQGQQHCLQLQQASQHVTLQGQQQQHYSPALTATGRVRRIRRRQVSGS